MEHAGTSDEFILRALREVPAWWPGRVAARTVEGPGECLLWQGSLRKGYGRVGLPAAGGGRVVFAHRVALIDHLGTTMETSVVDHLCRVRACVNPGHLRAVTNLQNILAPGSQSPVKSQVGRVRCPAGHDLAGENLRPDGLREGKRKCLTCLKMRNRQRKVAMRDARRALGLTKVEYLSRWGQSYMEAERILVAISAGEDPANLRGDPIEGGGDPPYESRKSES